MQRKDYAIRPISPQTLDEAMRLVWRTFQEFEAPDYGPKGLETFHAFLQSPETRANFESGQNRILGCFSHGKIIGVTAMRSATHISLMFVAKEYHRQGVGRALLQALFSLCRAQGIEELTLNASPYGLGFYHKIGFIATGAEREEDGIRYTPMKYRLI